MDKNIPVDVHVLVVYLEFLALEIIMTQRLQEAKDPKDVFNSLVLPQSWISRAIRGPAHTRSRPALEGLFRVTEPLIRRLLKWTGVG